jgi:hypothetical protein
MVNDNLIFSMAIFVIDHWEDDAAEFAARKANEMFALGNKEACDVWRRVREAVDTLSPPAPRIVH